MKTIIYGILALIIAGCVVVLLGEANDNVLQLIVWKAAALAIMVVCGKAWQLVKGYELD